MNPVHSAPRSVLLVLFMLLFSGCSCSEPLELKVPGALGWTIEGELRQDWTFPADQTGGQLTQQARVLLYNAGGSTLRIHSVDWLGGNDQMNLQTPALGAWPAELSGSEHLEYQVRYQPDIAVADSGVAQLRIRHDGGVLTLSFSVAPMGAKACVDAQDLLFINPKPGAPQQQCVTVSNCGDAPFAIGSTAIAPATPYWDVSKSPPTGTMLAPASPNGTPPGSAEVCVRLTADDPGGDYSATLLIDVDTPARKRLKLSLGVKWLIDNDFAVNCGAGAVRFDLQDATPGSEAVCTIHNLGEAPLKVSSIAVRAWHADQQPLVEQTWSVVARKPNGGNRLQGVFVVGTGNVRELVVTGPDQVGAPPPPAEVVIRFVHGLVPDVVRIPIAAGDCSLPSAVVSGASSGVFVSAVPGGSATSRIMVSNQSCAPLHLVQACVEPAVTSPDGMPCATLLPTADLVISAGDGPQDVAAWRQHGIDVQFSPPVSGPDVSIGQLRVVWCAGTWQEGACSGPLKSRAVPLQGRRAQVDEAPTVTLVAPQGQPGRPLKTDGVASAGSLPVGAQGGWRWTLTERPDGSATLISPDFEVDTPPWTTLVPDLPGTYAVTATVRAWDATDPTAGATSAPATVLFKVTP